MIGTSGVTVAPTIQPAAEAPALAGDDVNSTQLHGSVGKALPAATDKDLAGVGPQPEGGMGSVRRPHRGQLRLGQRLVAIA